MDTVFKNYYAGTSGLLLPVPNKLHYPEAFKDKSRLCYYASLMNTIEINSSFYKIPQASTIKKWAVDVPQNFRFTFKLFREITHNKDLAFDPDVVSRFFEVISPVEEKKACILVQFPPSIKLNHFNQLKYLMSVLRENDPGMEWKIALEFRHSSLNIDEIYELLDEYKLGMVIHDKSPANSPVRDSDTDFVYLRFHGPGGNYRGSYPDDILDEYADYVSEWLAGGKMVFVYFNNTMGEAYPNLTTLRKLVKNKC
ncbi:DUF72 domain-containing protein [Pedobacter sp. R20-19]|uniref:DUF72 domain-containing protein n=1 Tax=Pedobacter sp. R20-19 TaxID=1270196 RepID=UPI0004937DCF|nr:DUF72 domain-containing protein [Pedobacter sp. R20-19]